MNGTLAGVQCNAEKSPEASAPTFFIVEHNESKHERAHDVLAMILKHTFARRIIVMCKLAQDSCSGVDTPNSPVTATFWHLIDAGWRVPLQNAHA